MKDLNQTYIESCIESLNKAGIVDLTTDDVTLSVNSKTKVKFRLYTEEKWSDYLQSKNDAGKLASKLGVGEKPDYIVKDENTIYYVKLIKE